MLRPIERLKLVTEQIRELRLDAFCLGFWSNSSFRISSGSAARARPIAFVELRLRSADDVSCPFAFFDSAEVSEDFCSGPVAEIDGSTAPLASDEGSDVGGVKSGALSSGSGGAEDLMKASRDMNPRCGVGAGDGAPARAEVAGDSAPIRVEEGTALEPGGSSAMILRIEARISSMLGSAFISSLDIPHLLATETLSSPGQGPASLTIAA